jgi:hypothetical protein
MLVNDVGKSFPTSGFDFVQFKNVHVEIPRDVHCYSLNGWIGPDHQRMRQRPGPRNAAGDRGLYMWSFWTNSAKYAAHRRRA